MFRVGSKGIRFPAWYVMFLVLTESLPAQNLAPNPSFEEISFCPVSLADWSAEVWYPVAGTADNFHACASPNWEGVPFNFQGFQYPHSGEAYAGGYLFVSSNSYREFIQAPLNETLEAGHCYEIGCWINLADEACGINRFGFLLTPDIETNLLGMTPQIDLEMAFYSDSVDWTYVSGTLLATGNEAYISIGNFHVDAETVMEPGCMTQLPYAYYYIDDVVVQELILAEEDLDLGPPVVACDSYTIDPDFDADVYEWSDGSTGPTLTVTTSGTYSVSAYAGCVEYSGTIEVTIIVPGTVDLGPGPIQLCEGNTLVLSLDPAFETYTWSDGSTGPELTVSAPGTYSVTLEDGCHVPVSDAITIVQIFPPEPLDLGEDAYLCPGDVLVYELDPGLGDFLWQDGSTSSEYYIESEGGYELTISNPCGMTSDAIEVFSIEPVTIVLGPDSVFLCEGDIIDISLENDLADYLWQDGSTGPNYTIQGPGTYSVTATNPCGSAVASMVVLDFDPGVIDLGPPVVHACPGDILLLSVPEAFGDFEWQDGSTDLTFLVTTQGTYALTVTSPCGVASDEITVLYSTNLVVPDLGPDVQLCPGEQLVLEVDGSGGTILWSDLSSADTLLVSAAGIYSVQVSNPCFSYADTVTVTVSSEPPVADLPADFALCAGDTVILDAAVTGVNYLWSDGSSGQQLEVTSPGQYAVTVSSPCGMDADTVLVIAGAPVPVVSLGPDTAICPGAILEIIPVSSDVSDWQWQDGSNQSTLLTGAPGLITVTGSNACGSATDTMVITLMPDTPAFTLGADTAICPGETVTLSIGLFGVDILWFDGGTGMTNTISGPGTYYATVSTTCGSTSDTIMIDGLPAIPALDLGPDQAICPGESVLIDPAMGNGVAYLWQDGSTGSTFSAAQEGWVILTITNVCGMSTDSLLLTETTDGPLLDLGPDRQACLGDTVIVSPGIGGVNYVWQDGSTASSIAVTASGTYSLTISNACGTDSDTIRVDISGEVPIVDLGSDTVLCAGDILLLSLSVDSGTMILWQDNSGGVSFEVTGPGLYFAEASNRCGMDSDSVAIMYLDRPAIFNLGPDTVLCPGQSVLLQAPVTGDAIVWQDGSGDMTYLADQAGIYSLQVTNACGTVSDSLQVFVQEDEPIVDLGPDISWCPPEIITLDATQAFPANYAWSTGAVTPTVSLSQPGTYSVQVTTPCFAASDDITVREAGCLEGPEIFIPNVFSPNGDGINDLFRIEVAPGTEILGMEGSVYDRWGDLVFTSRMNPFTWDGRLGQTAMNPGVYVYRLVLHLKISGREIERTYTGDITLMR